jgi:hypothetical protein
MRLAAGLLLVLLGVGPVRAQEPPALLLEAPASLSAARARLESYDRRPLADIARLVGLDGAGAPIRVVLAETRSEWARMVPDWAAGFAVGEQDLVVVFPARSPMYPHDTLEDVLRHEVTHVLISRAAPGRQVPRWLHEGFAGVVERPWALEDRTRLASALIFGPRLGLDDIDRLFLGDQGAQSRAYSLSAAMVRHMMTAHGTDAPARVLRDLARGWPFDRAMANVTAQGIPRFEEAFWDDQRTWTTWVPLAASSSAVWLAVIGLAGLARRRRRQRSAMLRQQWSDEDP